MKKIHLSHLLFVLLVALLLAGDRAWISTANAQPASGQHGYAAQRERLVAGLQLDVGQQKKLDAIGADMLPRALALRGLGPTEREAAKAKLTAEMQQKINAMLTPDQRATYELMQAKKAAGDIAVPAAAKSSASAAVGS